MYIYISYRYQILYQILYRYIQKKEKQRKTIDLQWLWVSCLINFQTTLMLVEICFCRSITFNWFFNNDTTQLRQLLTQSQWKFIVHFIFAIMNLFLCWHLDDNSVWLFNKPTPSNRAIATFSARHKSYFQSTALTRHCFLFLYATSN